MRLVRVRKPNFPWAFSLGRVFSFEVGRVLLPELQFSLINFYGACDLPDSAAAAGKRYDCPHDRKFFKKPGQGEAVVDDNVQINRKWSNDVGRVDKSNKYQSLPCHFPTGPHTKMINIAFF